MSGRLGGVHGHHYRLASVSCNLDFEALPRLWVTQGNAKIMVAYKQVRELFGMDEPNPRKRHEKTNVSG